MYTSSTARLVKMVCWRLKYLYPCMAWGDMGSYDCLINYTACTLWEFFTGYKRHKRRQHQADAVDGQLLAAIEKSLSPRTEIDNFCDMLKGKLSKLTEPEQASAMHEIQNIMYRKECALYNIPQPSVPCPSAAYTSPPPHQSNFNAFQYHPSPAPHHAYTNY